MVKYTKGKEIIMREIVAELLRQGGSILSMVIRTREVKRQKPAEEKPSPGWIEATRRDLQSVQLPEVEQQKPKLLKPPKKSARKETEIILETPETAKSFSGQEEIDYRFECCAKHLGVSLGVLKEAIDRAIETGIGDSGVKQKVREAMVSLNAMEPDIEAMIHIPEAREAVEWLQSGQRNFRKAIWESGLERGKGTIDDLRAAHRWAGVLLDRVYKEMETHPGETCKKIL